MTTLVTAVNSPAVKALVADFVMTLGIAYGALALAPATFQDIVAVGDVLAFAVFKSAAQALARATLKWANA
jgi:hypothetical protein